MQTNNFVHVLSVSTAITCPSSRNPLGPRPCWRSLGTWAGSWLPAACLRRVGQRLRLCVYVAPAWGSTVRRHRAQAHCSTLCLPSTLSAWQATINTPKARPHAIRALRASTNQSEAKPRVSRALLASIQASAPRNAASAPSTTTARTPNRPHLCAPHATRFEALAAPRTRRLRRSI